MGYLLLFLATLLWSFVGILVKSASAMVDSTVITFARFGFGIVFLGLYIGLKDRGFKLRFNLKWVWLGALGKSCNYFFENLAISIGYSYGNILVSPMQTILLLFISALFLKERITGRGWIAAFSCVLGVLLISWNGMSLSVLLKGGALTTGLYALSAVGVAFHVLSQKMLIREMDAGNMNFSIFLLCTLMMSLPLPYRFAWPEQFSIWAFGALVALGLITGLSFYWFTQALRTVPFSVAVIVSNCSILFTVLWSHLVYRDPISIYLIAGVAICIAGLLLLSLPMRQAKVKGYESKAV
ncbi:DMT family transporter [Paenibacillus sp. BR2-3]|uniref:DMT family transporter n=1 Tax=Paenibacillus sp. BR2-3 TaxID=3048494 RepID=UPI003977664B